jgi:hypothetical protein
MIASAPRYSLLEDYCSLWEVSVSCLKEIIISILSGIHEYCKVTEKKKENGSERNTYKMEAGMQRFSCFYLICVPK